MRIVIDLQGAQTESRFRGIGRYSMNIAQAIARNADEHEIMIALNGLLPHTIEPIRDAFEGILPQENIRVWHTPGPVIESQPGNKERMMISELIRDDFLTKLNPDALIVTSLFEGIADDAVPSATLSELNSRAAVIFYDLIPMLNPNQYLPNTYHKDWYHRRLHKLKEFPLLLAISENTRQDALKYLKLPKNSIKTIYASHESIFQPVKLSAEKKASIKKLYRVVDPYIIYSGGLDPHKNVDRLIAAYCELPISMINCYQIMVVGAYSEDYKSRMESYLENHGVSRNRLIFCGRVPDADLVALYNMASLFVFPSKYEGFGFTPLEAMACSVPTIGSNSSSIPEVIGLEEALFDPNSVESISNKIEQGLTNDSFRNKLIAHGLQQAKKFSWDKTAKKALEALEELVGDSTKSKTNTFHCCPENQTASYASLINNIALIAYKGSITDDDLQLTAKSISKNNHNAIQRQLFLDVSELSQRDSGTGVQRVVRSYLKELLKNPPKDYQVEPVYATINDGYRYASKFKARLLGFDKYVLSDDYINYQRRDIFFGLDMQHQIQMSQKDFFIKLKNTGVYVVFMVHDLLPIEFPHLFYDEAAKENHENWLALISQTDGAICVSKATADAYAEWLNQNCICVENRFLIDFVHNGADLQAALSTKGMPDYAESLLLKLKEKPTFLIVGTLEPRKGCPQVLDCFEQLWSESLNLNLVFVGKAGWKMDWFIQKILNHPELNKRLYWLNEVSDQFLDKIYIESTCLISASFNEGFGLPLVEAAQHDLPLIVRDIPVFREIAGEYAFYFEKKAESQEIASAIKAWLNLYQRGEHPSSGNMPWSTWQESAFKLKESLVGTKVKPRQLLVDISELVQHDARTGIQRVVRSILKELLQRPPENYIVEPIYSPPQKDAGFYYAKSYLHKHNYACLVKADKKQPVSNKSDLEVYVEPGDIYLGLDFRHDIVDFNQNFFDNLKHIGIPVFFILHDILPVLHPSFFPEGTKEKMSIWLNSIANIASEVICVSKQTAVDFKQWLTLNNIKNNIKVSYSYSGADIENSMPSKGLPDDAGDVLSSIRNGISFLMVGTLEPRKGHMQVLLAFERLWELGLEVNLVIIGKQGWKADDLINKIESSQENSKKLIWLVSASDEYLKKVYEASTCFVAASFAEGFGLPLIEAAQHKLPIIARDISVFREVAGEYAYYFNGLEPEDLAQAILDWLELYRDNKVPRPDKMPWLTWEESTENLKKIILGDLNL